MPDLHVPPVRLSDVDGGVVTIEMADAGGKNAFDDAFIESMLEALRSVAADDTIRVAILAGTAEYFATGASASLLQDLNKGRMKPAELSLGRHLIDLPIPVVGAAEGSAIGGGLALLFSTDLMVIAEESRYGANFMSLGITPGMGTTRLLESALSPCVAHELLYTAELVRGSSLRGRSAFNAIVPKTEVRSRAMDLAWAIAAHPRENLVLLKRTLTTQRRRIFEEAMTMESLMHTSSLSRLDPGAMGS